ncbi:hypothetical protein PGT21_024148 [Puccinia graminis f. sp. tritici]|uniref:Uncharacterized protein n=1 Tax=Puccinia graminis f. sp. tritici TaxID=56615 RepID=A0A5B0S0C9_PUCGR|nr:hypothetical protein PGT21_024148 [Puccinia graminis f. sp. tritici]KAA1131766.1 hypothetical protein PGTUg99_022705 [Puccinia graminis f. sp. tritici]
MSSQAKPGEAYKRRKRKLSEDHNLYLRASRAIHEITILDKDAFRGKVRAAVASDGAPHGFRPYEEGNLVRLGSPGFSHAAPQSPVQIFQNDDVAYTRERRNQRIMSPRAHSEL